MRLARLVALGVVAFASLFAANGRAQTLGLGLQPAFAPAVGERARSAPSSGASATAEPTAGAFTALSYNVAGIPQFFSDEDPATNNPLIGPLLNDYDLVLLQEDFIYDEEISASVRLPNRSPDYPLPPTFVTLGDGLRQYSAMAIEAFEREPWHICSGLLTRLSDCTARKGFSYSQVVLADGASVDVYNLHLDAGDADGDMEARDVQVSQLIEAVLRRSAGRAVIVAGDTNMRERGSDPANLERLLDELELTDACQTLACGRESVDRVFYRSGGGVELCAMTYSIPEEFVDAEGLPLSDHLPIAVRFDWTLAPSLVAAHQ